MIQKQEMNKPQRQWRGIKEEIPMTKYLITEKRWKVDKTIKGLDDANVKYK